MAVNSLLAAITTFLVGMFICWYSGVDVFSRGSDQSAAFFISLLVGLLVFFIIEQLKADKRRGL
ncbi:MAG: hypothetical protein OQK13_00390 [Gammaproteobacteria bacterium]|nr:hypothetical protein [Gammaproteobacteria bacterium]